VYLNKDDKKLMDISVALGGGGSKGNSHIGVLRKLEQERYRIRALAGTSFGGIVSVFYAAGNSPAQIEDLFAELEQTHLYGRGENDNPSLLGLAGASKWLEKTLGERTFRSLKIPCAVTAVDLKSGYEVVLSEGRLVDALMATIAIPGIFPPRHLNNWELVDGGVLNPVPVSVARRLAPNLPVVAVILTEALGSSAKTWIMPIPRFVPRSIVKRLARSNYAQAFDIFLRSLDVADRALAEYRLAVDKPEIIIRPNVHHIDLLDKVDVRAVARLGEDATEVILPELKRVSAWPARTARQLRNLIK
jgi:NTE family protein